jgi:hypothetical protein
MNFQNLNHKIKLILFLRKLIGIEIPGYLMYEDVVLGISALRSSDDL